MALKTIFPRKATSCRKNKTSNHYKTVKFSEVRLEGKLQVVYIVGYGTIPSGWMDAALPMPAGPYIGLFFKDSNLTITTKRKVCQSHAVSVNSSMGLSNGLPWADI